jgi:hypothetical protein
VYRKIMTDGPPPAPVWVKVAGAIVVLLVIVVIVALISGGEHGPGRHL